MATTRREFCAGALQAGLAASALAGCASGVFGARPPGAGPFRHGVASGDPRADRVILWTRVSGADPDPVRVEWRVSRDPGMRDVELRGGFSTLRERDYTVKVDAIGLAPATTYYYQFEALGARSPIGRTRTLPAGSPERLRVAVASCSSYPHGYFNAYALIARRDDLDLVVHLGDYLYEYANGAYGDGTALGRIPQPDAELVTLEDYRTRHAQYKRDPDLQEAHRLHPFVAVWDDHESANNAWRGGAENHDPRTQGPWSDRRAAAIRAYFEWMPIRPFRGQPSRIYRSFRVGDLADLYMLDTRLVGRDAQADSPDDLAAIWDGKRSLLGDQQRRWLLRALARSQREGIRWKLLGQQVIFAPLRSAEGRVLNTDQWDGYEASRQRVLDVVARDGVENFAVLTGDFHSSWAIDLARDPYSPGAYDPATGRGSAGVEFVVPGISAPPPLHGQPERAEALRAELLEANPHVRYADWSNRGYMILDLDRERALAQWYFVDSVLERGGGERLARSFQVRAGSAHAEGLDPE